MTTADNGTTENSATAFFEVWQDMIRKSTEAWSQAATGFGGFTPPSPGAMPFGQFPFGGFPFGFPPGAGAPGSNPFTPPSNPADFMQTWQRMFESWQSQWMNDQSGAGQPPSIEEAQRQWARYLESMAATFSEVMSSEEFSKSLGQFMEQGLAMQERTAKQVNPQINAMLRAYNLPSRSQIDRMFARIIGMEEKLDDMEDEIRKLRSELSASRRPQASRSRSTRAPASAAGNDEGEPA
jgi:hypothetical protein